MRSYLGVAEEQGVTREEIEAVQSIVMAVAAHQVRAQVRDAGGHVAKPPVGRRGPVVGLV